MPSSLDAYAVTVLEAVFRGLEPVALALFGGFVRSVHAGGRWTLAGILVGVSTAGFAGWVVHLLFRGYLAEGHLAALTAVAGYAGQDLLPSLASRLTSALNFRLDALIDKERDL